MKTKTFSIDDTLNDTLVMVSELTGNSQSHIANYTLLKYFQKIEATEGKRIEEIYASYKAGLTPKEPIAVFNDGKGLLDLDEEVILEVKHDPTSNRVVPRTLPLPSLSNDMRTGRRSRRRTWKSVDLDALEYMFNNNVELDVMLDYFGTSEASIRRQLWKLGLPTVGLKPRSNKYHTS